MKVKTLSKNPLLEATSDVFLFVSAFKEGAFDDWTSERLKAHALKLIESMSLLANSFKVMDDIVEEAKYALVVFIDEVIMTSIWPSKTEWSKSPMQLLLFGSSIGGEAFFDRLDKTRQHGERFAMGLEIYWLCMQLGFRGKYLFQGEEKWLALQSDLQAQLEGYLGKLEHFRPAIENNDFSEDKRRKVRFTAARVFLLTGVLLSITYGVLYTFNFKSAKATRKAVMQQATWLSDSGVITDD